MTKGCDSGQCFDGIFLMKDASWTVNPRDGQQPQGVKSMVVSLREPTTSEITYLTTAAIIKANYMTN